MINSSVETLFGKKIVFKFCIIVLLFGKYESDVCQTSQRSVLNCACGKRYKDG